MKRMSMKRFNELKAKAAQIRASDQIKEDARLTKFESGTQLMESIRDIK